MSVSEADASPIATLDAADRVGLERAIALARDSGRTRWIARVVAAPVPDGLRCYAAVGTRDRFFWSRVETGDFFCAWGVAGESESGGRGRFGDLRAWVEGVRERIDWIGQARPATAPSFVGGFAFDDDGPTSEDWKAFPAARLVLPEVLCEQQDGCSRRVFFVRVEPGATAASVESELAERVDDADRVFAACQAATRRVGEAVLPGLSESGPEGGREAGLEAGLDAEAVARGWPRGPEYRVRSDRGHAVFRAQIAAALREIDAGRLEKVVLARSLRVDHDGELDVPAFLERLREIYPTCTLVALGRGHDSFLAATPETLVRVEGRQVETAALAGSAPRGRQPEEDRALAEGLLSSDKERAEHAHVVTAIRDVLAPHCRSLEVPETPRLRPLFGIQHLETPIRGTLTEDGPGALELIEALHPTPAVGGVPRPASAAWLRRFEGLDRGWYAAPIGWLDVCGGGDFRVALRSALVRGGLGEPAESGASCALLFAGAGIVAGSRPESELAETRTKLRALLAPLTEI